MLFDYSLKPAYDSSLHPFSYSVHVMMESDHLYQSLLRHHSSPTDISLFKEKSYSFQIIDLWNSAYSGGVYLPDQICGTSAYGKGIKFCTLVLLPFYAALQVNSSITQPIGFPAPSSSFACDLQLSIHFLWDRFFSLFLC